MIEIVFWGYLAIGAVLSYLAAPMSWQLLLSGNGLGNVPLFLVFWPLVVAAEMYKKINGEYPDWGPNI